jgi:hypothetical protein
MEFIFNCKVERVRLEIKVGCVGVIQIDLEIEIEIEIEIELDLC